MIREDRPSSTGISIETYGGNEVLYLVHEVGLENLAAISMQSIYPVVAGAAGSGVISAFATGENLLGLVTILIFLLFVSLSINDARKKRSTLQEIRSQRHPILVSGPGESPDRPQ